ncbi:MAG: helical backbone metal receptor [Nitrososphaerales archaeon]
MLIKRSKVIDDSGFEIELDSYNRVVSLAPSNTEILFSLGADKKLMGVSEFCNWPMEVNERVINGELKVIGGFVNPDFEAIDKLKPDLILGTLGVQRKAIENLRSKGFKVACFYPKSLQDIFQSIESIGFLLDKEREAKELIKFILKRFDEVSKITKRAEIKHFYYELANYKESLVTWGKEHWSKELANLANLKGIYDDYPSQFVKFKPEEILSKEVDFIIARKKYSKIEEIVSREGWSKLKAVKDHRIYLVDCFTNYSIAYRPSPRILHGLKVLVNIMHKELKDELSSIDLRVNYVADCEAY